MRSQYTISRQPGNDLYVAVRAGLVAKGESLNRWCKRNGIHRQYATKSLKGESNGPKARAIRRRLIRAAGLTTARDE